MMDGISSWRRKWVDWSVLGFPVTLLAITFGSSFWAFRWAAQNVGEVVAASITPFFGIFIFLGMTCLLVLPFRKAIVPGKFPRDTGHFVYGPRRLYGLLWTLLYYSGPLYWLILTVKPLKSLVLRAFGYTGSLNFVVYPDTWIRDLPLLRIRDGAYLSNKATIGTNICLPDGTIVVDKVKVGNKGLVGHLVMIGPGGTVGDGAEMGVGSALGLRALLGKGAKVGVHCSISHGSFTGENTVFGTSVYLGTRAILGPDLRIPPCAFIPDGIQLNTQKEVDEFLSGDSESVSETASEISEVLARRKSPRERPGLTRKRQPNISKVGVGVGPNGE